jgi:ABC-type Na+ efflux pump permease subunit
LLVILVSICGLFLPWWSLAGVGFLAGWMTRSRLRAVVTTSLAVFLSWVPAAYYYDLKNSLATGERLAQLFHLPHFVLVYMLIGLVGGVFAAFAALSGNYARRSIKRN